MYFILNIELKSFTFTTLYFTIVIIILPILLLELLHCLYTLSTKLIRKLNRILPKVRALLINLGLN